jgi:hypothetical protein
MANRKAKAQEEREKPNKSSVRHTRAIQRDRSKRLLAAPPAEQVEQRLEELILPATNMQQGYYRELGLRVRTLSLAVMVAIVVTLIWRQIGAGSTEIARLLRAGDLLWVVACQVSQQAVSERLREFPSELFLRILLTILPVLQVRWQQRQRPLPPEIAWALTQYEQVVAVDGSTLDTLLRRVGLLRGVLPAPLAGKMMAVLDLASRLPRTIWFDANPDAHDQRFWAQILRFVQAGTLLLFDLGYTNFKAYVQLTLAGVTFVTRAKSNLSYRVERYLLRTARVVDALVWVGKGDERQLLRMVAVLYRGKWYRYLTNERDSQRLPCQYVVALYWQRWRIEDAYAIVKRLLGLAYLWTGSQNGIQLQLWATWLLYGVLVDLTDAVAEALNQPFGSISMEMVYRGLSFFALAVRRGEATDPVVYLAANAKWLGIVKRKRKRVRLGLGLLLNLTNPSEP